MTNKKLIRLQAKIDALKVKGTVKPTELESIATSLQRSRSGRGKHPMWTSNVLPNRPPISIPHHSKELNRIIAGKILNQLEEDIVEMHRRDFNHEDSQENDTGEDK